MKELEKTITEKHDKYKTVMEKAEYLYTLYDMLSKCFSAPSEKQLEMIASYYEEVQDQLPEEDQKLIESTYELLFNDFEYQVKAVFNAKEITLKD